MVKREDSDLYFCKMIKYQRDVILTLESYSVLKRRTQASHNKYAMLQKAK